MFVRMINLVTRALIFHMIIALLEESHHPILLTKERQEKIIILGVLMKSLYGIPL